MNFSNVQMQIIALIKANPQITAKAMQQKLELSETEFYHEVRDLKRKGILTHVGMANSGTWVFNKIENGN